MVLEMFEPLMQSCGMHQYFGLQLHLRIRSYGALVTCSVYKAGKGASLLVAVLEQTSVGSVGDI